MEASVSNSLNNNSVGLVVSNKTLDTNRTLSVVEDSVVLTNPLLEASLNSNLRTLCKPQHPRAFLRCLLMGLASNRLSPPMDSILQLSKRI